MNDFVLGAYALAFLVLGGYGLVLARKVRSADHSPSENRIIDIAAIERMLESRTSQAEQFRKPEGDEQDGPQS